MSKPPAAVESETVNSGTFAKCDSFLLGALNNQNLRNWHI